MDNCSVKTDPKTSKTTFSFSKQPESDENQPSTRSSVAKIVAAIEAKTAEFNQINSRNKMVFKSSNTVQAKNPNTDSPVFSNTSGM